jgi:peptide/nickel transport system permease protein
MTASRASWESGKDSLIRFITSDTFIYVIKRLLQALLTLFFASALSFIIIQLAPGDYLDTLRQNPKISPERIAELKRQFGLDKSWFEQFFLWLQRILTKGDFGQSFVYQRSVSSLLWERVPATLYLAISSLVLTWAIAIPLGIFAAVKQNRAADRILQVISYAGQGFPSFVPKSPLLCFRLVV